MSERIEIDLDAIERTALAATPGPWSCSEVIGGRGHGFCAQVWDSNGDALFTHESMEPQANADVGYCQVANPVVILELVRRLREAEKDAARWRKARSLEYCNAVWCEIGAGEAGAGLDAAVDAMGEPK